MSLVIEHVQVQKKSHSILFDPVTLTVNAGEVCCLMGPSGCGKSTLLNVIAGHLPSDFEYQGQVWLNEQRIDLLPAHQRQVGILFQDDLLFPHLTVLENLAFALPNRYKGKERKEKSHAILETISLTSLAERFPHQLSGGQSARISLSRMLLAEPKLVLLDEPFSKLDKSLRIQFRDWVFDTIAKVALPVLMVTHDEMDVPRHGRMLQWPWFSSSDNANEEETHA